VKTNRNYFYGGRLIVNFVPKFVNMATRVVRGEIQMTPSIARARKGGYVKTACNYLSRVLNYSQFCPKSRCHGNRSWQGRNLYDTFG